MANHNQLHNNQRPQLRGIEGGNEPDSSHPITRDQFRQVAGAMLSILAIGGGVSLFTNGKQDALSTEAVCHGVQPFTAERGHYGYDVLGQIEGGIDNPRDATAAIHALNPGVSINDLRGGQVLTLPQVCESEDRNVMGNIIQPAG